MTIVMGGGKKANRTSHSATLKEATTWEEAIEYFAREFKAFFPSYQTLDKTPAPKKEKKA